MSFDELTKSVALIMHETPRCSTLCDSCGCKLLRIESCWSGSHGDLRAGTGGCRESIYGGHVSQRPDQRQRLGHR